MKINELQVMRDVLQALSEDVGSGDVTASLLPQNLRAKAQIITREPMLVCGRPWVDAVFQLMNREISVHWLVKEGDWLENPQTLCYIEGQASSILTAERTALNFLQTLAATATETYHYVQALKGTRTKLLDTRKTIPGLRMAQKYAVVSAGGVNHRQGLYDAFLIKENHINAWGSLSAAVFQAKKAKNGLMVEVEVETLEELQEAIEAKPDRILLDNFSLDRLKEAVTLNAGRCELEASGGMDLHNLKAVAETGVDYISVGRITKSIKAIDLSLGFLK